MWWFWKMLLRIQDLISHFLLVQVCRRHINDFEWYFVHINRIVVSPHFILFIETEAILQNKPETFIIHRKLISKVDEFKIRRVSRWWNMKHHVHLYVVYMRMQNIWIHSIAQIIYVQVLFQGNYLFKNENLSTHN